MQLSRLNFSPLSLPGGMAVKEFKATCPITGLTVIWVLSMGLETPVDYYRKLAQAA